MPIEAWNHPPTLQKVLEAKSWGGEAILHTRGQSCRSCWYSLIYEVSLPRLFFPSYQVKMYLPLFLDSPWLTCLYFLCGTSVTLLQNISHSFYYCYISIKRQFSIGLLHFCPLEQKHWQLLLSTIFSRVFVWQTTEKDRYSVSLWDREEEDRSFS